MNWDATVLMLNEGRNYYRWVEYSISAPTMILAIDAILGGHNLQSYMYHFASINGLMWFGLAYEFTGIGSFDGSWIQVFAGLFSIYTWVPGALELFAYTPLSNIPVIGWFTALSMFVLFSSFGYWQFYWHVSVYGRRISRNDYYCYEKGFAILSFVAKTILVWTVVWGGLTDHSWLNSASVCSQSTASSTCGIVYPSRALNASLSRYRG